MIKFKVKQQSSNCFYQTLERHSKWIAIFWCKDNRLYLDYSKVARRLTLSYILKKVFKLQYICKRCNKTTDMF